MRSLILVCVFSLISIHIKAQITANPTQGCAPLIGVQFTGISGATGIQWNFGDGGTSGANNPTHTFVSVGTYTVSYTATVSGSPTTQTLVVNVFGKPTPNFTSNFSLLSSHCAPAAVDFTDQSTGSGSSTITSWQWAFGDGGVSSSQNPSHPYTISGNFNVTLTVRDINGCDSSRTLTNLIHISTPPSVSISTTPSPANACAIPFSPTFNGSASVSHSPVSGGGLTYDWNLGNTTTATTATATTTYTAMGTYSVSLTCTDNNQCSNTANSTVVISSVNAQIFAPDTVCINSMWIATDSSQGVFSSWNYGDGTPPGSTVVGAPNGGDTIHHVFTTPGLHQVILTTFSGPCSGRDTFRIFVEEVTANFTSTSPSFGCTSPYSTTYNSSTSSSNGSPITSYQWSYNNQYTSTPSSTLPNPTISFNQNSLNEYTIFENQPLTATLTVTSAFGCTNTITQTLDTLHRPTAYFYTDEREGCTPLTITFTDSSFSHLDGADIVNYAWHFDDGTPVASGPQDTLETHTYTVAGDYNPYLVIQTSQGCVDTSFLFPVHASSPPVISFSTNPNSVCPNEVVTITNTTQADTIDHWHVIADGWSYSHCTTDSTPSITDFTHTGVQDITMLAYSHGCEGSTTLPAAVTVKGPIVKGRHFNQCGSNAYTVMFEANLQDTQSATWDFGDGTPPVTITGSGIDTVYHTYSASGYYNAVLTGINGATGCSPYVDSLKVTVKKAKAVISLPGTIICENAPSTFSASSSLDVYPTSYVGYTWFFDTLPPIMTHLPTVNQALSDTGSHTIMLIVRDENECRDTAFTTITASGVRALLSLPVSVGCLPAFTINPVDAGSTSSADATIMSYSWNYGDGTAGSNTTGILPAHTYTAAVSPSQTFTVSYTIVNTNFCSDVYTTTVTVNAPKPTISSSSDLTICAGTPVTFNSGGSVTDVRDYIWKGIPTATDSIVTSVNSLTYNFNAAGTYTVIVKTVDSTAGSCAGTSSTNVIVSVQAMPQALFSTTNMCDQTSAAVCAGCNIVFIDTSNTPNLSIRNWDLATGSPIIGADTVGTTYTTPGTYSVSLALTTTYGCKDTLTKTINVLGATADFVSNVSTICKGESISFDTTNSSGVFTFAWDFGDGTDTTAISPVMHPFNYYPPSGTYNVVLNYWTDGLACKYSVQHSVNIRSVLAGFIRNTELTKIDSMHCIGSSDVFTNTSVGANTYNWNFGDGQTSTSQNPPTHTYATAGTYTVELSISDNLYNCTDVIQKEMTIYPLPTFTVSATNICLGDSADLYATVDSNYQYNWLPNLHLDNSTSASPKAGIDVATTFTLEVTDINNCKQTDSVTVNIQEPPVSIDWDTTVVVGQIIPIPGYAGNPTIFTNEWVPATDLSCTNCTSPISYTLVDIIYVDTVRDVAGCFEVANKFEIHIIPASTVDVPTAFTPNGDGENDVVYVKGWGIKKLNYFKIYNRWGQLVFESNDLSVGWDGIFQGVPQNMETYVYQVSAVTYTDAADVIKKGTLKLIR